MKILQTLRPLKTSKTVIYERSLLSSRWVFWEVLKKKGLVTKGEDETYSVFYDEFAWYPDVYIFLSKTPELAWEHIRLRNQKGDSGVTVDYWKELDVEYKKLLKIVSCVVHVINANKSVEEIHKEIYSIILEHELLHPHAEREKVQEPSSGRREVSCTPYPDMCCVSWGDETYRQKTKMQTRISQQMYYNLVRNLYRVPYVPNGTGWRPNRGLSKTCRREYARKVSWRHQVSRGWSGSGA